MFTAGSMKGVMDPFKDIGPEELATVNELLGELHESFKKVSDDQRCLWCKEPYAESLRFIAPNSSYLCMHDSALGLFVLSSNVCQRDGWRMPHGAS